MADFDRESMLEMFIYEMNQLIENLEERIMISESNFEKSDINEIFRIMHTIKGSSAMMLFDSISQTSHAMEDMFFYLREESPANVDSSKIADIVLEATDFIKNELGKIERGEKADGICDEMIAKIRNYLLVLKGEVVAPVTEIEVAPSTNILNNEIDIKQVEDSDNFNMLRINDKNIYLIDFRLVENCEMMNIRAYTTISNLELTFENITHYPENLLDEDTLSIIEKDGFQASIVTSESSTAVLEHVLTTSYTNHISFKEIVMGNPNEKLDTLNKFCVNVNFTNGNGEGNINIINFVKIFEMDSEYIIIDRINVESVEECSVIAQIFTPLSKFEIETRLESLGNINAFEIESTMSTTHGELVRTEAEPVFDEIIIDETLAVNVDEVSKESDVLKNNDKEATVEAKKNIPNQVISVGINKLDQLLNLMGELVIAEAMVTQNPELDGMELETFYKDARQLHKIINDVQDIVMSMRMVPLSSVFFKMHRIVRDMSRQLGKDIDLVVKGEETEVDKNIIEHISDPLMHMIRNSIDHGIESEETRMLAGKQGKGTVTLEAKNSGGDVLIIIKDNGRGLDIKKIMAKAKANGLLKKPESEYTEKEIHQFIFQPGFSTNDQVTNFSGRGVGMDVVINNLLMIGGSVEVSSVFGEGSEFTLKIPLTLAIIEGMIISLGGAMYTIPIISIRQSFKGKQSMISTDPSGNEMITVRGEVYDLIRLSQFFNVDVYAQNIEDGIIMVVENGAKTVCLFVDSLVGERQVVVKSMPKYINTIRAISGCTLLGNGDISLIIDVAGFFNK